MNYWGDDWQQPPCESGEWAVLAVVLALLIAVVVVLHL